MHAVLPLRAILAAAILIAAVVSVSPCHAQTARGILRAVVTVTTGVAAAGSVAEAAEAKSLEESNTETIRRLTAHGIDPRGGSVYSLRFSLQRGAESIYWADFVGRPDVYLVINIEGQGRFLVPRICHEYAGQLIQEDLFLPDLVPGQRVLLELWDDDSLSDTVWNNVLRTSIPIELSAGMSVKVVASATVQLLDRGQTIDGPDYLGGAEFVVPQEAQAKWGASAELYNPLGAPVGSLALRHVWKPDLHALEAAVAAERSAHKRKIFWGGTAIVLGGVFLRLLFGRGAGVSAKKDASAVS